MAVVDKINSINHARLTLTFVRERTNKVILFYSGGKDSIVLLDMLSFLFDEIHCVFMYFVDDLQHQQHLLSYPKKYGSKVVVHKYPHWMLTTYFRDSYFRFHRIEQNVKLLTLKDIEKHAKNQLGIDWVINGAKQSDSLQRNLMLRRLKFTSINEASQRVYPLSIWSKKDVISYIWTNRLMLPESYGIGKSNGVDLTIDCLLYLKNNYPEDLTKILKIFPFAETILINHADKHIEVPEV